MDQVHIDSGARFHPACEKPDTNETAAMGLLSDLTDVIRWADNQSARSQQATIGPSELGGLCDRKIAYRIAGAPESNQFSDPLPAIVGTAIHTWLERAVGKFQSAHFMERWLTEITVHPDPLVVGHCDLYDRELEMVVDYKTVSPTKLKAWKTNGPPEAYKNQVSLYAKGAILAGLPVKRVALVAIPRAGFLTDARVWADNYDPARAQALLDRLYGVGSLLLGQGEDMSLSSIPAAPGAECSYCPWMRGGPTPANLSGCPGNSSVSMEKFGKGLVRGN
jgi:hypothetical protein